MFFPFLKTLREILSAHRIETITKLAAPIIGGMSSQIVLNLVDTAMVGRLGAVDVAAVGITSIALWVLSSPIQGISPAVQTITSRRLGEGAHSRLHEAIVTAIYLILVIAIPLTAVLYFIIPFIVPLFSSDSNVVKVGIGYMSIRLLALPFVSMNFAFRGFFNGLHRSSRYLQTILAMHITNIVLNYLLIFGKFGFPEMGSRGAALASLIAIVLGSANYFRLLLLNRPKGFTLKPNFITRGILNNIARLAIPMSINGFFLSMGYLVFYRITAFLGTNELAATNIIVNLMMICFLPAMGMGLTTMSLVSKAIGEGRPDEAKIWSYSTGLMSTIVLALVGILFALFPEFWIRLFIKDPDVIFISLVPLVIFGLSQLYDPLRIILMHVLLGGGANKLVMKYTIAIQWGFFLPFSFILVKYLNGNLANLWIAMVCYRFLLLALFIRAFVKEKWLHNHPV